MIDRLKPGKGKSPPRPKTPAPILVPSGKKNRSRNKQGGGVQKVIPPSPQAPPASEAPREPVAERKKQGSKTSPITAPDSVQRATTQLLPGRLEPEDPDVFQQEIRFIRLPGEAQVVTLGWKMGEPPGHITLNHRSVEPLHARMCYQDGNWYIESLAPFDPLEINRKTLEVDGDPRLLRNGDRVRIGDIVFHFFFP